MTNDHPLNSLKDKVAVIMGVANNYSIATGIAKCLDSFGVNLAFSYLPDKTGKMKTRVEKALSSINHQFLYPCDVSSDQSIEEFFDHLAKKFKKIDYLIHSIAFCPMEHIKSPVIDIPRDGFIKTLDISVYSLITCARHASKLMTTQSSSSSQNGSIVTMTYYGGEKVVAGYNIMGVAKSALEAAVRYLSYDLGKSKIRVNAISAGPIKTLASSALGVSKILNFYPTLTPLSQNINSQQVGESVAFLLSDLSSATTGQVIYVDGGYHLMAGSVKDKIKN